MIPEELEGRLAAPDLALVWTEPRRLRWSSSGRTGSGTVASRAEEYRRRAQQCL